MKRMEFQVAFSARAGYLKCLCLAQQIGLHLMPALFVVEQPLFALQTAAVAGEAAVFADDAVAGNEDGEAVGTVGGGHGAYGGRFSKLFGQRLIMGGFAVRDGLQRVPHPPLKRAAGGVQRHAKLAARTLEIFAQLGLHQSGVFVFALLGLAAEQALEIAQFIVDAPAAGKFEGKECR